MISGTVCVKKVTDKSEFIWRFFLRTFLARKVLKLSKETLKKGLVLG
jgi:hypothetical protein